MGEGGGLQMRIHLVLPRVQPPAEKAGRWSAPPPSVHLPARRIDLMSSGPHTSQENRCRA
jgi:hypothetical protein